MTTLREAAQQALEALYEETAWFGPTPKGAAAIAALRAALAQQDEPVEPVEPVAWMFTDREGTEFFEQREDWDGWWTPLYTAPPRCPNCASLEAQNTELDRKLSELEQPVQEPVVSVDELANHIRVVDGNHSLGAGALAEKIVEFLIERASR